MERAGKNSKRPRETDSAHPSRKRQTLSRGQVKNYKAHLGIPSRRVIDGPGIWAMVVKGKEKQAVGELYNVIETISDQLWPKPATTEVEETGNASEPSEDDEDIEKQLAKELSDINKPKSKPSAERRIDLSQASGPHFSLIVDISVLPHGHYLWSVVVYISTKPPIDPVRVALHHMEQVSQTGISGTRTLVRLIPASGICAANMSAITALASNLFASPFGDGPKKYKIELRIRNHAVLVKEEVIKEIAKCVPADKGHAVSLTNQDTTILVEVFKGICTMAVVPDYDKYKRFNVTEIVKEKHKTAPATGDSRVVPATTTS
ncbi:hypothetical protein FRC07_005973 [Ceratobasidium sp. 392]|nr:hypothetical protein FRC07_005973 [Ceratobasidium sp. 392]